MGDRRAGPCPLLPEVSRPAAGAAVVGCVSVVTFFGAWFAGQTGPSWLDRAVDGRARELPGSGGAFALIARLGEPRQVAVMMAVLIAGCAFARRWRGVALVLIAVPAAAAITELALKPFYDRRLGGSLTYPSGHCTALFSVAGVAALVLLSSRGRWPPGIRWCLTLAAYLVALIVAVAVVAAGMHYFTDTFGGIAVGTGTVVITAFSLDWLAAAWERRRS